MFSIVEKLFLSILLLVCIASFSWEIIKQYVSIRRALGIVVNKLTEPIPNAGQVVLHNFIELIE